MTFNQIFAVVSSPLHVDLALADAPEAVAERHPQARVVAFDQLADWVEEGSETGRFSLEDASGARLYTFLFLAYAPSVDTPEAMFAIRATTPTGARHLAHEAFPARRMEMLGALEILQGAFDRAMRVGVHGQLQLATHDLRGEARHG